MFNKIKKNQFLKLTPKIMKLEKIVESYEALNYLAELKLPITLAFKLSKVVTKFEEQIKFFNKVRGKKLEEYGEKEMEKDDKGKEKWNKNFIFPKKENKEKFRKEMTALLEEDIKLDVFEIKIDKLKDGAGKDLEIPANIFAKLDWLIKE